jgi:hypothetical protein
MYGTLAGCRRSVIELAEGSTLFADAAQAGEATKGP